MSRKSGGVLAFLILCWISAMYFPQPDAQASNIVQSTTPAGLTPGNSGGIPFYLTTTTFGSSPTWTLNTLLTGGGAGLSPAVTGVTIDGSNNMAGVTSITVGTQIGDVYEDNPRIFALGRDGHYDIGCFDVTVG